MVWLMMAADAAKASLDGEAGGASKSEASLDVFAIPDETDEEFADYMFSRKSSAVLDDAADGALELA